MQAHNLPDFTVALHSECAACIHRNVHTRVPFVVEIHPQEGCAGMAGPWKAVSLICLGCQIHKGSKSQAGIRFLYLDRPMLRSLQKRCVCKSLQAACKPKAAMQYTAARP